MKKVTVAMVIFCLLIGYGSEVANASDNLNNSNRILTRAAATFSFNSTPPKKYKFGGRTFTLNYYKYSNGCYIGYYS